MSNTIDLQISNINQQWQREDNILSLLIDHMQQQDTWTQHQGERNNTALLQWPQNITTQNVSYIIEHQPDALIKVFALIDTKRSLYLFHCIEALNPGSLQKILERAVYNMEKATEDNRAETVLLERLVVLFTTDLLQRLFSKNRSERIKRSAQKTTEEFGGLHD